MKQGTRLSRLYHRLCCFTLFFIAASASFNGFYTKYHFFDYGPQAVVPLSLPAMVDGTGFRPFVYRQMLPTAADWIDSATPAPAKSWLYNLKLDDQKLPNVIFDSPVARTETYFFRYLIVYLATFLFAFLAVYAMHLLCNEMDMNPVAAVFAPVVFILLLPYIQSHGGFDYDFVELAFMAFAAWAALKFDWWWIIPLAALGTWNKESFLFFIPTLYPIIRQRSSQLSAAIGIGVLCLVSGSVYSPIHARFSQNPGYTAAFGLPLQIRFLLHPARWIFGHPPFDVTYGLLLVPACSLVPMALLVWTVLRGWRHLPQVIQRHGKIAAAINIPLYLLLGNPGELRGLSLLYVTFMLLLSVNLTEWIKGLSGGQIRHAAGGPLLSRS